MASKISINEWIHETLFKHGRIRSQRDLDDFVKRTDAGKTKFNKWMRKAGLRFDKYSGFWNAPMSNGKPILIPTSGNTRPIRNKPASTAKNPETITELFSPETNGNWPEIMYDETVNLSKYTNDEVIELAKLNPGFGFRDFVRSLYPSSPTNALLAIREILDSNIEFDLYDFLQSSKKRETYSKISKRIPLSVQQFDWGNIEPEWERSSHQNGRFGLTNTSMYLNVRYDMRRIWQFDEDGYSLNEVSFEMDLPYVNLLKWTNKMKEYDDNNVLEEWLELVELLNRFSTKRGLISFQEEKEDQVYIFIRRITQGFLKDPEKWTERPCLEHLEEIFAELNEFEHEDIIKPAEEEESVDTLFLIGNQLDSSVNFQLERMLNNRFYEPLIEQSVTSQVNTGSNCVIIDVSEDVPVECITEFVKAIVSEVGCSVFVDRIVYSNGDSPFLDDINNEKLILATDSIASAVNNNAIWIYNPILPPSFWANSLEFQRMQFNDAIGHCKDNNLTERVWLRPMFGGFFSPQFTSNPPSLTIDDFNRKAMFEYLQLIEDLSKSGHRVCADFRLALTGINSVGNTKQFFESEIEKMCISRGATVAITNTISRGEIISISSEDKSRIERLFEGDGFEFLQNHTPYGVQFARFIHQL